jgi:hypothetical protein
LLDLLLGFALTGVVGVGSIPLTLTAAPTLTVALFAEGEVIATEFVTVGAASLLLVTPSISLGVGLILRPGAPLQIHQPVIGWVVVVVAGDQTLGPGPYEGFEHEMVNEAPFAIELDSQVAGLLGVLIGLDRLSSQIHWTAL